MSDTTSMNRELYVSRIYDSSRQQIFRAWTEPKQMARWWGPKDFTNPVCEVDARVGGKLAITMHGPDGQDYPMRATFTDVRAPERIAFEFEAMDAHGHVALKGRLSMTLTEEDGRTRLNLSTHAEGVSTGAAQKLQGMEAGWNQSLDRLRAALKRVAKEPT
jgi:uncharacterized protein YndB with AHSA1/START domain